MAKHGGASEASIFVSDKDGELLMTGKGTGRACITPDGGLAGLLERVQTMDGQLAILSP